MSVNAHATNHCADAAHAAAATTAAATGGTQAETRTRDAPAFDFYPERWLVGVAGMSDAEQLSYLRLLCHQWLLGDAGLPPDAPALKRLAGKGVTPAVLAKLPLHADGKRRNARLETIRAEQRERIAKKSEQRRAAANKRWHSVPHEVPADASRPHGAGRTHQRAAGMRSHCGGTCETVADAERMQRGGACGPFAAAMPTTHLSPPTSHPVPEDANNAGAGAREAGVSAADAAAALALEEAEARAAADAAADRAAAEVSVMQRSAGASVRSGTLNETPSLETVLAWAVTIGCPPDKAEIWWHEHEARPLSFHGLWTDRDGNAVQRPQHALAAWWQKWQANDRQRSSRLHAPSSTGYHGVARPTNPRSDTANAPGRYA